MQRRSFIQMGGLASGMLLFGCRAQKVIPKKRMNILFIMDDQHRGDCIGAAGADWLHTPNLDRLAAEGALFNRAYSSTPSCLPARAAILTGLRPWNHGLLSFLAIPNKYKVEMPQLFTDAGYRTHVAGKNHFYGAKHGYQTTEVEEIFLEKDADGLFKDDYLRWLQQNHPEVLKSVTDQNFYNDHRDLAWKYAEETHPTHWTAERAKAFLREYKGEAPWFLKFSLHRPHCPLDPPRRLVDKYLQKTLPSPAVGPWAEKAYGEAVGSMQQAPKAAIGHFPDKEIHESRAAYYASIEYVDEKIGEVLEVLKERGELENTFILFTSDHGDMMGDNYRWQKCCPYEPSARVPMLIRWPAAMNLPVRRGQQFDHLVELRDIMPTFLDAAGLPVPGNIDGKSMVQILRDSACPWRDTLEIEHGSQYFSEDAYVALTDKRYKYIYFTQTGDQQLFDLKKDPKELNNITDPVLLAAWRKRMVAFLSERGEEWVKNGDLVLQTRRMLYSPNFKKNMLEPADEKVEKRFNPSTEPPTLKEYIRQLGYSGKFTGV
ncbi:MAG TPA: arylsulfatase [Pontiellaceae bacterium]|nr:arylsulfatase [Pontiellaceae bacterium]